MKKALFAPIIISILLISLVASLRFANLAKADQFYVTQSPPSIVIARPDTSEVYELEVPLKFTINYYQTDPPHFIWGHHPIWLGYTIDGAPYVTIEQYTELPEVGYWETLTRGSTAVDLLLDAPALSNGLHTVTIKADFQYVIEFVNAGHYNYTFSPVSFTINRASFTAHILSPTNGIYNFTDIPLNFTVNRQIAGLAWIGYSLDNQPNATISGNTTLTGLINGFHSLVIYANDTFGSMGVSEVVNFTIAVPEMKPDSFSVVPVAAASITLTFIVGAGLLFYFKKRKH